MPLLLIALAATLAVGSGALPPPSFASLLPPARAEEPLVVPFTGFTDLQTPVKRKSWRQVAAHAAKKHGLPMRLFLRQIAQESGFNPQAKSPAGAVGIAQIRPETAKGWGVNPQDPEASLYAAAKAMAGYWRTYQAQGHDKLTAYKLALAAYNAGCGAVAEHKRVPPYPETQHYVRRILQGVSLANIEEG